MPNSASPLREEQRLFPLAPDQLGAAHSWFEHGERSPRKPRLASSVVLVRDGAAGTETYLGYRSGSSPLGTVAFPGGSVDDADGEPVTWFGPSPAKWAETMGINDLRVAQGHVVAAIRELFEETGVLLAGPDESSLPESTSGADWMRTREAVAGQEKSFAEALSRRGLGVRTDLLKPLSNWLSPDFAHRRFDTRYFAAAQPANQRPSLLESKGVWAAWLSAQELMAGRETTALGDLVDQPDTRGLTFSEVTSPAVEIIVEKIASARGCIAYLSHKRPQRIYHPELVLVDGVPMLQVVASAAAEGGAVQRGR
ncbi:NUDIX hydrolase [Arthrobacter sulfonylureivorans]|uniref:NUDIX hydrolase n=1 Tax=Arthrobacter sulfonylureivorans TaxID=2486855 RepID=A0ABY3W893_9MICC|nr:NUDIX hydrolase [Arthrobacter sulfonylureivorans]UNK46558.1 NUDIX hydrolase [Arthrobacter sulfonylureivorans]